MEKFVEIITTAESKEELESIADALVSERLAACVQIAGPIESIYKWDGKIEKSEEWECRIKSSAAKADQVGQKIKDMHSYEVPQIIMLPVLGGSEDYLRWVEESID